MKEKNAMGPPKGGFVIVAMGGYLHGHGMPMSEIKHETLYRPAGLSELAGILESGSTRFPPCRDEQWIFYPVLKFGLAEKIARRWHVEYGDDRAGFVTEFALPLDWVGRHENRKAGGLSREVWVPADKIEDLNDSLAGPIKVSASFYGQGYKGPAPTKGVLAGLDVRGQLPALVARMEEDGFDLEAELVANRVPLQANFPYFIERSFADRGVSDQARLEALRRIVAAWRRTLPGYQLPGID